MAENTARSAESPPPATVEVFDRLPNPEGGRAARPPRASLYHTKRAERMRNNAARIPQSFIDDASNILVNAGLRRAHYTVADVADHNAMTLAAALAYADAGLHVVDSHAIDPRTGEGTGVGGQVKIPRGSAWQERATNDCDEVISFWTGDGKYPADKHGKAYRYASAAAPRNVSIAFPANCGLFVLDIDGEHGRHALEALEAEHGELPMTWESVTGSGGLHLIFKADGLDIRNTASQIAPGVDIRGKNGQIIAAPSIHATGNFYNWDEGCAPWECTVADAPEWLVKLAIEASKQTQTAKTKKS